MCVSLTLLSLSLHLLTHPQTNTKTKQSQQLAEEIAQKLPAAALAGLVASLSAASPSLAIDYAPGPDGANTVVAEQQQAPSSFTFQGTSQVG